MANTASNYLASALTDLHEATSGVNDWSGLHNNCDLHKFEKAVIEPTEETMEPLQSLQDSLKTIAEILSRLKADNKIPNYNKDNQRRAHDLITEIRKKVDGIKDCFMYPNSRLVETVTRLAAVMETLAAQLKEATLWAETAASSWHVSDEASVTGFSMFQVGNQGISSKKEILQDFRTSGKAKIEGVPGALINTGNFNLVTDGLTEAQITDAINSQGAWTNAVGVQAGHQHAQALQTVAQS